MFYELFRDFWWVMFPMGFMALGAFRAWLNYRARREVVEALREVGIDASDHVPRKLEAEALEWADIAVSTCSEEVCPVTPGVRRISWQLPDPKNLPLDQVRPIRDELQRLVTDLAAELDAEADFVDGRGAKPK